MRFRRATRRGNSGLVKNITAYRAILLKLLQGIEVRPAGFRGDRDEKVEQEGAEEPAPVSAPYRSAAQVSSKVSGSTIIRITYLPGSLPPAISISRQSESQRRICLVATYRLPSVICLALYEWQPVVSRSHETVVASRVSLSMCSCGYKRYTGNWRFLLINYSALSRTRTVSQLLESGYTLDTLSRYFGEGLR